MKKKIRVSRSFFIIIAVVLILSLFANIYWGYYFYPVWYPQKVNIPSEEQVNNFCRSLGYDGGFINSYSCNVNEVMCHSKIFDLDKYKCEKWGNK